MKRLKTLSMITIMLLALTACGDKDNDKNADEPTTGIPVDNVITGVPSTDDTTTESTSPDNDDATTTSTTGDDTTTTSGDDGDFDVSGPKWNWIKWDADGDGAIDEIEFEYIDNGDEATSFVRITYYDGNNHNDTINDIIDRAYGLNKIYAKEDSDGPYLHIYYDQGDFYGTSPAECELRIKDGKIEIKYIEP